MNKNPYMISIAENSKMQCYEVQLTIGNFTKREAEETAKFLNEWMQQGNSDKSQFNRVQ